jgi:ubiquinone/menaquinone biosynthesis C-methylase UbiE
LDDPRVRAFITAFERWNEVALPIMNAVSTPYLSIQKALAKAMAGKVGGVVVDFGCGAGSMSMALFEGVYRIIAVDPDLETLRTVPQNLHNAGYTGDLTLVNSSSMVPLPLEDGEVDAIVSGLGAVIYSGFHVSSAGSFEGEAALAACLRDCNRVLKMGGCLGFSSLVPNPDFGAIKRQSIWGLAKAMRFKALVTAIMNSHKIEAVSGFMKESARAGHAHYLSEERWQDVLGRNGFGGIEFSRGSYAGQGLVVTARKTSDF